MPLACAQPFPGPPDSIFPERNSAVPRPRPPTPHTYLQQAKHANGRYGPIADSATEHNDAAPLEYIKGPACSSGCDPTPDAFITPMSRMPGNCHRMETLDFAAIHITLPIGDRPRPEPPCPVRR